MFEDAINGVQGALSAGMQVVWVPDERCDTGALKDDSPLILTSLSDLDPPMFALPPYDDLKS